LIRCGCDVGFLFRVLRVGSRWYAVVKAQCGTLTGMKVDKMSISSWLAEAAAKPPAEALAQFLDEWECQHGPLTADELARAERELGLGGGRNDERSG
jgi:hypothetical protein